MIGEEAYNILSNGLLQSPTEHEWCVAFKMAVESLKHKSKTGHWIPKHIVDDCSGVITWYECSECGRRIDEPFTEEFILKDYPCCHCGAKMEGVKE